MKLVLLLKDLKQHKLLKSIEDNSMPYDIKELFAKLVATGACESYYREKIYYLAYVLESKKIEAIVKEYR